jgi:hypothetical protein
MNPGTALDAAYWLLYAIAVFAAIALARALWRGPKTEDQNPEIHPDVAFDDWNFPAPPAIAFDWRSDA